MNRPNLKILIAHYRSDIVSGAENSITDLVKQLNQRFQITMLVPGVGRLSTHFQNHGIKVCEKSVSTPRRIYPGLHLVQSLLFAYQLKRDHYDAVICNTIAAGYRVSSAAKLAGLPLAIHMRDYISRPKSDMKVLNRADAVFAISQDVVTAVSNGLSNRKVHLAYNFINAKPVLQRSESHKEARRQDLPFPDYEVVGWIGRLTPYKQPEVFIQAIPIVLDSVPTSRFVIIGSAQEREKPYEMQLKSLAHTLGIEKYLAFMGQRNDVIELSSELALSCLTSKREPLGRVILEANLLRIPTVVPNTGGPAEIILPGVTGLQFDPLAVNAHQQLAQQMITLLTNPVLRKTLTDNGYKRVNASFASHDPVARHEYLYEQLCCRQL
jgi:glycosyltransferase involved in cell wall biosynthesis